MTDSTAVALQRLADSLQIVLLERSVLSAGLSASWTGVVVGLLGVLFAVLAIITAFALYRQTKDFHARAEAMVAAYRNMVEQASEDARLSVATALDSLKAEAATVTKRLEETSSSQAAQRTELEDRQRQIEQRRKQLEEREAALDAASRARAIEFNAQVPWHVSNARSAAALSQKRNWLSVVPRVCPNCGWVEQGAGNHPVSVRPKNACPDCGYEFSKPVL